MRKFVINASSAYLIERGRITTPVSPRALIGTGGHLLGRVSMIGTDIRVDEGIGTCTKAGQAIPVGVGMPTIKVEGMTVGDV
jgi:TldD protein